MKFLVFSRLKINRQDKILCGRFVYVTLPCYTWQDETVSQLLPTFQPCSVHCQGPVGCLHFKAASGPDPRLLSVSCGAGRKHPATTPRICSVALGLAPVLLVGDDGIQRVWWVLARQVGPASNCDCKSFTVACEQLVFWSMTDSGMRFKKSPQNQ